MILGQEIALEVILIWKDDAKEGGSWGQGKVSGGSLNLLRADCPAQIQTHTQSQGSLTTSEEREPATPAWMPVLPVLQVDSLESFLTMEGLAPVRLKQ